jgi:hypothetical protein
MKNYEDPKNILGNVETSAAKTELEPLYRDKTTITAEKALPKKRITYPPSTLLE